MYESERSINGSSFDCSSVVPGLQVFKLTVCCLGIVARILQQYFIIGLTNISYIECRCKCRPICSLPVVSWHLIFFFFFSPHGLLNIGLPTKAVVYSHAQALELDRMIQLFVVVQDGFVCGTVRKSDILTLQYNGHSIFRRPRTDDSCVLFNICSNFFLVFGLGTEAHRTRSSA